VAAKPSLLRDARWSAVTLPNCVVLVSVEYAPAAAPVAAANV